MENESPKLSIEEFFAPLAARLFELENLGATVVLDMNGLNTEPSIRDTMDTISKHVDRYESQHVIIKCKLYLKRIDKLEKNLIVPIYYDLKYYDDEFLHEYVTEFVKRSKDDIDRALRIANNGLDYCKNHLLEIIENHKSASDMPTSKTAVTEIKLPENFTVKQLNVHFDPLLSLRQATLFLFYLREKGVIPNYNASDLGRLGEIFFARNNKNIREELTDIYENRRNSEDLKALQQILKSILKEVESDLENAR